MIDVPRKMSIRRGVVNLLIYLLILGISIFVISCSAQVDDRTIGSPEKIDLSNVTSTVLEDDPYIENRLEMVEQTIKARGVSDPDVLDAMQTVPRHLFVPDAHINYAYSDTPLPIGYGQTISQPYMVAWMTELLDLQPGDRVLEIGTGSGYQAAVLAEFGGIDIYTIEIVPELAESAAGRLDSLGYDNVQVVSGDGYFGWDEYAPFNAIIVTAAPDHLPPMLAEQLTPGGRLIVPIGPPGSVQTLWKFIVENGELKGYNLGSVTFVPFTGAAQE